MPYLILQTLLYPFLVSVSSGIKKFLQKVVLKFRNSSILTFLKSKLWVNLSVVWVRLTIYTQKMSFRTVSYEKKYKLKYNYTPRGCTQISTEMPFFPLKTMESQKLVSRRIYLILICICEIIFFTRKYISKVIYKYRKSAIFVVST